MSKKIQYGLEDLKSCSTEELVGLVYNKACELHFKSFGIGFNETDPAIEELFATWVLDSEVRNGGFDQFFLNNGIELGLAANRGLARIGADQCVEIMNKAIEIHKNESEEFTDRRNPMFNPLDEHWYEIEKLEKLQEEYVRTNLEKFIVKE